MLKTVNLTASQVLEIQNQERLEDEMMKRMSKEISDRVDFEIMSDLLVKSCGWHKVVRTPFVSNKEAVDIKYWIEENCKGYVHSRGYTWIFESEKDALLFSLKWGK